MKKQLQEQYLKFPRKLLDSPVWQVLTGNEFRALFRIMQEHQRHSGKVYEGLPITKLQFDAAGVKRNLVASSLRVIEGLGIVTCTRRVKGTGAGGLPNLYRPTFISTAPSRDDATHDYLKITTVEEARKIAHENRLHDTRIRRAPPKPRRLAKLKTSAILVPGGMSMPVSAVSKLES
jgi:hypothetical protein